MIRNKAVIAAINIVVRSVFFMPVLMYDGLGDISMPKTQPRHDSQAEIEARIRDAGKRAAAEAEARRKMAAETKLPPEINGQKGPEPTRFGDWEKKGIISDF
jgi:hypothetical protein